MRHKTIFLFLLAAACLSLQGCGDRENATAVAGSEGPLVIYPD